MDERRTVEVESLPYSFFDEKTAPILCTNQVTPCWIANYTEYIKNKALLENNNEARKLKKKNQLDSFFLKTNSIKGHFINHQVCPTRGG